MKENFPYSRQEGEPTEERRYSFREQLEESVDSPEVEALRDAHRVAGLLEIAEESVQNRGIGSYMLEEMLSQAVRDARERGSDLSSVSGLDARIAALGEQLPISEIEGTLEHLRQVRNRKEEFFVISSWYWAAKEKLERYRDKISAEKTRELESELAEVLQALEDDGPTS